MPDVASWRPRLVIGDWGFLGNWLLSKGVSLAGGKATDAIIAAITKELQNAGLA